ncbi:MAG: hypothetical protein KatS3mg027_2477 [Bacteroidia bacterium]|nr:MAG: hypothetical protein KatS3mg027_2477 [Bacteroidia bacterium]
MEKIKKAYYLLFYKIYRFYKSMEDDGFADWKAGLVIQTLQIFVMFIIIGQTEIITKHKLIPAGDPKIWATPIAIMLAIFNYYIFLHRRNWKNYEEEFRSYSRQKNRLINFIVFCIIFGTLLLLIFTLYLYSKVDRTKYK